MTYERSATIFIGLHTQAHECLLVRENYVLPHHVNGVVGETTDDQGGRDVLQSTCIYDQHGRTRTIRRQNVISTVYEPNELQT